jgi:hypothetical protein
MTVPKSCVMVDILKIQYEFCVKCALCIEHDQGMKFWGSG